MRSCWRTASRFFTWTVSSSVTRRRPCKVCCWPPASYLYRDRRYDVVLGRFTSHKSTSVAAEDTFATATNVKHLQRVHAGNGHLSIRCAPRMPAYIDQYGTQVRNSQRLRKDSTHLRRFTPTVELPDAKVDLDRQFSPSLLNSAVYIMSMTLQIVTFAVNYRVRKIV